MSSSTRRTLLLATIAAGTIASPLAICQQPQKRDLTKGNTMYVVPYAHLDTQWRWAYPQVIREFIKNTLTRNFALMDKYPHYVFNFSGSRRYEMMKEYYPAEFQKLKTYVAAGKWFPCGSSVDEGDANVPSAESIIRHVLYGNRFFEREFHTHSQEFMLPDCFGFPYALPTVLAHCGVKGFSTQKLTWGSAVGIPFKVGVWEGPDGKSVVAALDPGSYSADINEDLSENTSWLARIQNTGKKSGAYVDYHYYGTGDVGGSPSEASVQWVEKSVAGKGPITVVSSHADQMVKDLQPAQIAMLPRYKGELLLTQHSAGSITSQAYMKRWNRKNEQLADAAEKASVGAMTMVGTPYPSERLYNAWDLVLGSQMHDMLPGTSIPKAYEFCWNDELLAMNQFSAVEQDAIGALSKWMDTRGEGQAIAIYNPLSVVRGDVVEAEVPDLGTEMHVDLGRQRSSPVQVLSRKDGRAKVLFQFVTVPTGVAICHVQPGSGDKANTDVRAEGNTLSNARFDVTIDKNGDIASIYDKKARREVLKSPSRLVMQYHNPGSFPAWNMDWEDAQLPPKEIVGGPANISVVENGPVRAAIRIERECNGSKFIQTVSLTNGADQVDVLNKIDWQTRERALKASFSFLSGSPNATYDLQVGALKRGNNNEKKYEVPQHQWLDLSDQDNGYGAAILNDSKYGSDKPDDNTVRLTLIYTPGVKSGFEDQATQDFGRHEIRYSIAPHEGSWQAAGVPWKAKRLNQPLRAFLVGSHQGMFGSGLSFAGTSTSQVEVQALKKAEASDEVIVRLRELTGAPATHVEVDLGRILSAREVNGQEQSIGPAKLQHGALIVDVPAFSLRSYAVRLAKAYDDEIASRPLHIQFDTDVISTRTNYSDGAFSGDRSIAAEQWPNNITVDEVKFELGSGADSSRNAISSDGQTIALPEGARRVYVLAAAEGDVPCSFRVGGKDQPVIVQNWGGYVGQWDNRLWAVDPGPNYTNYGDTMSGLLPGYVKPSEVAWFASHCHTSHSDMFYEYSYVYKYGFDVPNGATTITLPKDRRVKVFAVSTVRNPHDYAVPGAPLSDTLADHATGGAPTIEPGSGSFKDVSTVRISPPLYWNAGGIHYSLDGNEPTSSSAVYTKPFELRQPTTIKATQFDSEGLRGPVVSAFLNVKDVTPPSLVEASIAPALGTAKLRFNEALERSSALDVSGYSIIGIDAAGVQTASLHPVSATLDPAGKTVMLSFTTIMDSPMYEIDHLGVRDLSGNEVRLESRVRLAKRGAVFTQASGDPKLPQTYNNLSNLPVQAGASFTLNLFCRTDQMPEDLTMIAGFGRASDGRTGTGKYFSKFEKGINFWIANRDVATNVPLDIGKWQMLTAVYDGETMRLYKNGLKIAEEKVQIEKDLPQVRIMPLDAWDHKRKFDGEVKDLTIWDVNMPDDAIKNLWNQAQKS